MFNYCTLFDSNYLTRGLAMYESLKKYSTNFHLYIFAFDERSYNLLKKLNLQFVTVVSLHEFENSALLAVKPLRTNAEYCWTCTPSIIAYCLEKLNLAHCTYLDADLYFFSDPSVLIEEMQNKSVSISEHRYTPKYDQSKTSGIYCVQFMTFKNDEAGRLALHWWRDACIDWCYNRLEDGKFGDQKYLDDWTIKFNGIHVLQNSGAGIAPWNVQQYNLASPDFKIIFYHFHGLKFIGNSKITLNIYDLNKEVVEQIYKPYIIHLELIRNRLEQMGESYDYHGTSPAPKFRLLRAKPFRFFKEVVKRFYNRYDIERLIKS